MAWSQDEERMLVQIENYLTDEDPRLAARLESFNERVQRKESGERKRTARQARGPRRGPSKSTIIIMVSWLLIATLIATLLIMVFHHDAAALPM
ncbi:DUF3040 domain-containing protein [Sphaerisporangium corydalis]|uniref:DUF3040 domain-containing protein n=1 Tax=Sphaerisporangium corydalis TaxID=1441875 RepID=A0ABV9EG04_9ACTN|nr:DUF3040 domain-containing protein [Sphaerisporangium corydalis]